MIISVKTAMVEYFCSSKNVIKLIQKQEHPLAFTVANFSTSAYFFDVLSHIVFCAPLHVTILD